MFPTTRQATDQDAELIATLTRAAWAGKVAQDSSAHHESAERVLQDLSAGGAYLLIAPASDEIIGSARWTAAGYDANHHAVWEMMRVGVLAPWRGRGWASVLVAAVLNAAHAAAVGQVRIGIRHDQPRLLDYYATFGFRLAPNEVYRHANPANPPPWVMVWVPDLSTSALPFLAHARSPASALSLEL